jgi:hypothetical protein
MDSACASLLEVPPPLYENLLEPSGAIQARYRSALLCWADDKAMRYSGFRDGRIKRSTLAGIREVAERCAMEMSKGKGYPRRVGSPPEWFKIHQSEFWDMATWNGTAHLPWTTSKDMCECSMDEAVSSYLGALYSPPWQYLESLRARHNTSPGCLCNINVAWRSYAYLFNISFATTSIPWSGNLSLALGWVGLIYDITFPNPAFFVLPKAVLHGFYERNLPPKAMHDFWMDVSPQGLPRNSTDVIRVPTRLSDALRDWGRNGTFYIKPGFISQEKMTVSERKKCVQRGWCDKPYVPIDREAKLRDSMQALMRKLPFGTI